MTSDLVPVLEASISQVQERKFGTGSVGLRKKLLAIMADCSYIKKDKRNLAQGYNYASEAAIKEKVQPALVRHGVLFQCDPVTLEERLIERTTKDGRPVLESLVKCQFHYCFEDVETGEKREGTFFGTGLDGGDKALYKAITGAAKYILTTTFLIPTGDDPEEISGEEKVALKRAVEEKLEAAKNHKPAKEPDPNKGWFQTMLDGFASVKAEIGQEEYSRILGVNGFQHANQIPNRITAMRVYKEMTEVRSSKKGMPE